MSLSQAEFASPSTHVDATARIPFDELRALARLALPIMLIALVNMGMSLTDTAMVARIFGTDVLAAVAVGSDLYSIVFYLGAGVLGGLAPFYAGAIAAGDTAARARLERAGWLTAGLAAAVTVPAVWSAPVWLAPLGLDPALLEDGAGYTRAMAMTLAPMLGVVLYRTLLTAAQKPSVFLKITLAMLPLNAGANYVLMTGVGPVPAFGPAGAGWASFVVAAFTLAVLFLVAQRSKAETAAVATPVDWSTLAAVLRVGVPIGIATVAEVGVFLGATLYAATLGAADVAAHTLTLRTAGVAYAIPTALLQASMVRLARADSLGDPGAPRRVVAGSLTLSLVCGTAVCLLLALAAGPLSGALFDQSVAGLAAAAIALKLLFLLGALEFLVNPCLAAAGLLRGRKDTRAPMTYTLVGYWAVGAPLGIALCELWRMGVTGLWIGLATGTTVTTVLTLARLAGLQPFVGRAPLLRKSSRSLIPNQGSNK